MADHSKAMYRARNYDTFLVQVPKGKRDLLRAEAARRGQSLNAYVLTLLERDTGLDLVLRGELPTLKK